MNKVLKWILIGLGIAFVVFLVAMIAFRGFAFRPSVMMGGRVPGFHHPFGGMMFGMGLLFLFRILFGATVLGLAVFGLITLFKHQKNVPDTTVHSGDSAGKVASSTIEPQRTCAKCSQPLKTDWKNCPYCGKKQ